jgi:hypothetical protein
MSKIKSSGLYDATNEIRLGIVNDEIDIIDDIRFHDPKIFIVAKGHSSNYERTTLLHMRKASESDPCCQYFYFHTKGIRFFDSSDENIKKCVISWINLMIHWNISNWKTASEKLLSHDTHGCELSVNPVPHYSGNYWWANSHYIRTLSNEIGENYCDPEFWLLKRYIPPLICNIYSTGIDGGGHYCVVSTF